MFCCRFDFFIRFLMTCSICEASENRIGASVKLFYYIIWTNWCNTGQIILQSWAVQCWWVRALCSFSFRFLADRRGTWRDLLVLKLTHSHGSVLWFGDAVLLTAGVQSGLSYCSSNQSGHSLFSHINKTFLSADLLLIEGFFLYCTILKKTSVNTSYRKTPPWHGQSFLDHTFLFLMVDVNITQGC